MGYLDYYSKPYPAERCEAVAMADDMAWPFRLEILWRLSPAGNLFQTYLFCPDSKTHLTFDDSIVFDLRDGQWRNHQRSIMGEGLCSFAAHYLGLDLGESIEIVARHTLEVFEDLLRRQGQ